jgi:hypothetical protein
VPARGFMQTRAAAGVNLLQRTITSGYS